MEEYIMDEDLINYIMDEIFDFCVCGRPFIFVEQLYEYLTIVDKGELPDDKYTAYMYLCDKAELTEHGGSVIGAWLTDKGKTLLKQLEEA